MEENLDRLDIEEIFDYLMRKAVRSYDTHIVIEDFVRNFVIYYKDDFRDDFIVLDEYNTINDQSKIELFFNNFDKINEEDIKALLEAKEEMRLEAKRARARR